MGTSVRLVFPHIHPSTWGHMQPQSTENTPVCFGKFLFNPSIMPRSIYCTQEEDNTLSTTCRPPHLTIYSAYTETGCGGQHITDSIKLQMHRDTSYVSERDTYTKGDIALVKSISPTVLGPQNAHSDLFWACLGSVKADSSLPELDQPFCSDRPSLSRHSVSDCRGPFYSEYAVRN